MSGFQHDPSGLVCDGVPLSRLADEAGTPLYVYSAATIRERYRAIDEAFAGYPHTIHYALKANSTLAIVRLLRGLGSSVDANSGGEVELALRAGFIPPEIILTGVGKTRDELARAVALGLKAVNAESAGELERIAAIARSLATRARVALRINPDVDAESHPHISTGLRRNKFGVPIDQALEVCRRVVLDPALDLAALHVHVGSQIMSLEPLRRAATAAVTLARALRDAGVDLDYLDLGGGLGISYDGTEAPSLGAYAATLLSVVRPSGLALVLEPGRTIVGPAGVLVARVVDVKAQQGGGWFVVIDAGMSELMRPALYGAYHRIQPVVPRAAPEARCDVVGPLCESSDTVGADRQMERPEVGDLLAVFDTGAYGSVMASNYNRRPLAPEVLVDDGRWTLIRRRQSIEDMLACEV